MDCRVTVDVPGGQEGLLDKLVWSENSQGFARKMMCRQPDVLDVQDIAVSWTEGVRPAIAQQMVIAWREASRPEFPVGNEAVQRKS